MPQPNDAAAARRLYGRIQPMPTPAERAASAALSKAQVIRGQATLLGEGTEQGQALARAAEAQFAAAEQLHREAANAKQGGQP